MKLLLAAVMVVCFGSVAQAEDQSERKKMKGEIVGMNAEGHMKMADHLSKMSGQHKALAECLKANSDSPKEKCKEQREALKATRAEGKSYRQDWKGKRKAMREKIKGMKKKSE